MDIIQAAIDKHGAKAVYNAAVAHMEGKNEALAKVDLGAANMGVAYNIMLQAHEQMTPSEQAADYWDASQDPGMKRDEI